MAGTYGLSFYGAGPWGLGGGERGEFTATSAADVTAVNNINSFATIDATSGMVGRSISTVLAYGLGQVTSAGTVSPTIDFAGRGSGDSIAGGSGTLTIDWDGVADVSTTWTEIEIT